MGAIRVRKIWYQSRSATSAPYEIAPRASNIYSVGVKSASFLTCLALAAMTSGCAKRDTAYHFRGPGVSAVQVPELSPRATPPSPSGTRSPAGTARIASNALATTGAGPSAQRADVPGASASTDLDPQVFPAVVPVAEPAEPGASLSLADTLRAMVGSRRDKKMTDVQFVLAALAAIGTELDEELAAATTGSELVALADARGAISTDDAATPLLGDLIMLTDSVADDPVIAIVVAIDQRGTIELVHLTRTVVRRSYLTAGTPNSKRDGNGAVLNTLVVHREGDAPKGTRYLAGQLFSGHIRLDQLVER